MNGRKEKEESRRRREKRREAYRGVRRYFAVDAAGSIAWRAEELAERETTGEEQRGTQIGKSLCIGVRTCDREEARKGNRENGEGS